MADSKGAVSHRRYERFGIRDAAAGLYRLGLLSNLLARRNLALGAVDLSEVGAQLIVGEELEPGLRLRMLIRFEQFHDHVEGEVAVRWCARRAKKPGEYLVGLEFITMPSGQFVKIQHLRKTSKSAHMKQKLATKQREQREKEQDFGDGLDIIQNPNT